jgi:3',5'-cyclic AMP phosphodiesterase CpdA
MKGKRFSQGFTLDVKRPALQTIASTHHFAAGVTMLSTRYQKIDTLSVQDIARMYELFAEHYAFSPFDTFLSDLHKKDGVFIVRQRSTQQIVGFSTLGIFTFKLGGREAKGLFSGDTIIEQAYRGSRSLQGAFARKLLWEALKAPLTPQYWLLISKGYKTYLLMARNFPEYYPRRGKSQPHLEGLVTEYCDALFPGKLDTARMVLDFGDGANCLHDHVAEITDVERQDADIAYFERRNPSWQRGTELPCIARADLPAFARFIWPFLGKVLRGRGRAKSRTATALQTGLNA